MKYTFFEKYKDYFKSKDTRDDIFKMQQGEKESLEDYAQRFQINYKRAINYIMDEDSMKLVLLKGVRNEFLEILNLFGDRDTFHKSF